MGTATFDVVAEEVTGDERDRLYAGQLAVDPSFAAYEQQSTRRIPVIALRPVGSRESARTG